MRISISSYQLFYLFSLIYVFVKLVYIIPFMIAEFNHETCPSKVNWVFTIVCWIFA